MPLLKANDFWKPNTYYYATERYKSLIEKDNTLYICSESHLSQDEFDATKFVGIIGSGGLSESQVNDLIDTKLEDFMPSGAGGFSFGGDWDASGTISQTDVTHFEYFSHCEMIDETLTLSASTGVATVSHISQTTNATQKVRFTWPSTPTFFIGLTKSTTAMTNEEDLSSAFSGTQNGLMVLAAMGGSPILMYKYGEQNSLNQSAASNSVSVGDIVEITLMADINGLSFINVTENTSLGYYDLGNLNTHEGFLSFVVFTYGNIDIDFSSVTPLQIDTFEVNYPADITKTYRVSAANANSVVNGKLLKVNDFVDFITNEDDEVVDVAISRLITDAQIKTLTDTAINYYLDNEQSDVDSNLSLYIKNLIQTELQDTNSSIYQAATYLTQAVITTETQSTGIIDTAIQSAINH